MSSLRVLNILNYFIITNKFLVLEFTYVTFIPLYY